jgi:hypothetical protein
MCPRNLPKNVKNALLLFGMFTVAYNLATAVHELGHVLGVTLGGGSASHVKLNPFTWSYTFYASNPRPLLASWSGSLFEIVLSLAIVAAVRILRASVPTFLLLIAIVALGTNGVYLAGGTLGHAGDAADLIRLGISPIAVFIVGTLMMLAAGGSIIVLQPRFGIPYTASIWHRATVIVGGAGAYLVIMLLYVALLPNGNLRLFLLFVGAGLLMLGVVVVLATMLRTPLERLSLATLTADVPSGKVLAYLIAGILVVVLEIVLFGR